MLKENQDYFFAESSLTMNAKQPLNRAYASIVSTKDHVYIIPTKTIGMFMVLNTITTHRLFQNTTIPEGLRNLIAESGSVSELEQTLSELLQNDEKLVHKVSDQKSFKFRGFLGKHTLRMAKGMGWTSVMAEGKGKSKEFRVFHGQ